MRRSVRDLAVDVRPLRDSPPFRRLFAGQLVSLVGRQITVVAVSYQVYSLTHSPFAVGALGLVQAVPLIAFSLLSGAVTDRIDRRSILLVTQLCLAVCSATLLAGALSGRMPVWGIYTVVAVAAAFAAVDSPTRTAVIPRLVERDRLPGALSLNIAVFQTSLVAGPALGGLVIARFGLPGAYAIDVGSFAAAFTAVLLLPRQPPTGEHHEPPLAAIRRGLSFARSQPVIMGGFAMDLSAMIFGLPRALFPVLAATTFHVGPAGLGFLYAAPGAGAVIAALTTGWLAHVRRLGRVIIVTIAIWGLVIIVFGFVEVFWVALVLLVVAGAADSFSAVCRNTIMQTLTPDELRGRITSLYFMVVVSGPYLGDLEAGAVASLTTPQIAVVSGGVLSLVGLAVAALVYPAVWAYRAGTSVEVAPAPTTAGATSDDPVPPR